MRNATAYAILAASTQTDATMPTLHTKQAPHPCLASLVLLAATTAEINNAAESHKRYAIIPRGIIYRL